MNAPNTYAVTRLQNEINDQLKGHCDVGVSRILLDHGSDVSDLTRAVDVRVFLVGESHYTLFSILTCAFLDSVFSSDREEHPRADVRDMYTRGGPLIIVRSISGEVIVRAVLYYIELRDGRC